jgi:tetratricopeptide (TPR) repeat protein
LDRRAEILPFRRARNALLWAGAVLCAVHAAGARAAEPTAANPGAAPGLRAAAGPSPAGSARSRTSASAARLEFIARLYAERDDFRAESELLAFLHEAPDDPLRPQAELARAKLYYRAGRLAEADGMAIALLDREPDGPAAADARLLLGFSWLRQGRLAEAAPLLAGEPALAPLEEPPPNDAGRAVAWSTALPGAGFFTLGEPAKGATALALNLAFLAGTVLAYQQHNVPAALIFLTVEAALYTGGRDAVRDEAERLNGRWREERRTEWLTRSSEGRLMAVAFDVKF